MTDSKKTDSASGEAPSITEFLSDANATDAQCREPMPVVLEEIEHYHRLVRKANLYRILDLAPSADRAAIKDSYFKLMGKFHPDLYFGNPDSSLRDIVDLIYKRITISYEILSDPQSRQAYDLFIAGKLPRPARFTRLEFINTLNRPKSLADESELEFHQIIGREE
jgi:DnaJ domain